ncbi:MAG: tetratricopeptide repeat protein [Verrucomicrobiales bacterium]
MCWDTSRFAEAEPLYRRALAIDEAAYGENHPEVATDLNSLANCFGDQPLLRRAYRRARHLQGSLRRNHPTSLSNRLRPLLSANGDYAERSGFPAA